MTKTRSPQSHAHLDVSPSRPRRAARPAGGARQLFCLSALAISIGTATVRAEAAEPAFYAIEKSAKDATVGTASTASVAVVGKNGWHVNAEAPITLTLVADPGVALAKGKLTRADLAETSLERARFDLAFTPSTPGKKKITGDARFVMCQEQACKPVKESVVLEVAVAETSPATGKATSEAGGGGSDRIARPKASGASSTDKAKPTAKAKAKARPTGHPASGTDGPTGGTGSKSDPSEESW